MLSSEKFVLAIVLLDAFLHGQGQERSCLVTPEYVGFPLRSGRVREPAAQGQPGARCRRGGFFDRIPTMSYARLCDSGAASLGFGLVAQRPNEPKECGHLSRLAIQAFEPDDLSGLARSAAGSRWMSPRPTTRRPDAGSPTVAWTIETGVSGPWLTLG